MARKTVLISDLTGQEIDIRNGATEKRLQVIRARSRAGSNKSAIRFELPQVALRLDEAELSLGV